MKLVLSFVVLVCVAPRAFAQVPQPQPGTANPNSLRTVRLPTRVKDRIADHLYSTWFQSPSDPPYLIPKEDALNFNVTFLDVAKNNQQVILLESNGTYAGATGNGEMWFFLRSGDNVRLILHTSGFLFDNLPAQPYHNGLRDFATGWRLGCCEGGIQVFRFNGTHYVSDHCADYTSDGGDEIKVGPAKPCQIQSK